MDLEGLKDGMERLLFTTKSFGISRNGSSIMADTKGLILDEVINEKGKDVEVEREIVLFVEVDVEMIEDWAIVDHDRFDCEMGVCSRNGRIELVALMLILLSTNLVFWIVFGE